MDKTKGSRNSLISYFWKIAGDICDLTKIDVFLPSIIFVICLFLLWPLIIHIWSVVGTDVDIGLTNCQTKIYDSVFSVLGVLFTGLSCCVTLSLLWKQHNDAKDADRKANIRIQQADEQISLTKEKEDREKLERALDHLNTENMGREVYDFIKRLYQWHIREQIVEINSITGDRKSEYYNLKHDWQNIVRKYHKVGINALLVQFFLNKYRSESAESILLEAEYEMIIGECDKFAIAAICYPAAHKDNQFRKISADEGIGTIFSKFEKNLKHYIEEYLKKYERNQQSADLVYANVLMLLRESFPAPDNVATGNKCMSACEK